MPFGYCTLRDCIKFIPSVTFSRHPFEDPLYFPNVSFAACFFPHLHAFVILDAANNDQAGRHGCGWGGIISRALYIPIPGFRLRQRHCSPNPDGLNINFNRARKERRIA